MTQLHAVALAEWGDKNIAFVRYNPHSYRLNGVRQVKTQAEREKILVDTLKNWKFNKSFELQYLFYSAYSLKTDNGTFLRNTVWDHKDYNATFQSCCREPIV
jgi:hypothetical protein